MANPFCAPEIDDLDLLNRLPQEIVATLQRRNGFFLADGAFHMRGACQEPKWHSLRAAWEGDLAFHRLYPEIKEIDIPLAEDCFGDQFLLRDGSVIRLFAETGEIEPLNLSWSEFLTGVESGPGEFLDLRLPDRFRQAFGNLQPGFQIHVYPPFVAQQCINPSMRPIPAMELKAYQAELARQIRGIGDGQLIKITVHP